MTGAITDLAIAGRLALKSLRRRLGPGISPAPDTTEFHAGMDALLAAAPADVVRDYHWFTLPADRPPWFGTGIQLQPGEELSYFVEGRVYANRFLDIWVDPGLNTWCRVGDQGHVFRGTRRSHSFISQESGELFLGNYFPNDWSDEHGGRLQDDSVYAGVSGEVLVLVIRWASSASNGLTALRDAGDYFGTVQSELRRLQRGDTAPAGWHYLWHLGPAEIYRDTETPDGAPCIHCDTRGNVGILQKDVDLPLAANSEISWRWCVEQLPSTLREDSVPSHDYLSIAVEFDNGRDITYYWSSTLPVGTGYDCPLPNWQGKEYHVVIRSGKEGLGRWQEERRNLYLDYQHYMGDPPKRITRVWLIANSIFQRGSGRCDYADIVLHKGEGHTRVL